MYLEFNRKLLIYAPYIILHRYFKLIVYVSQFYFNVTNKVARYTVQHRSQWKSQINLMDSQRFIKTFLTKLFPLYLSPMKLMIDLSTSFNAGLISPSFSGQTVLHYYMVIKSPLHILQHKQLLNYKTYFNVYAIFTYYLQFSLTYTYISVYDLWSLVSIG